MKKHYVIAKSSGKINCKLSCSQRADLRSLAARTNLPALINIDCVIKLISDFQISGFICISAIRLYSEMSVLRMKVN